MLGDKCGRKLSFVVLSALACAVPFAFAALTSRSLAGPRPFPGVLVVSVLSYVVAGLGGPIGQALQADGLPTGADGQTDSRTAARDIMVLQQAGVLPGLVLPPLVGRLLTMFSARSDGYIAFFLIGGVFQVLSVVIFYSGVVMSRRPPSRQHPQ